MKLKFLDARNCHQLFPNSNGLPLMVKLDECLHGINKKPGELHGSVDVLIRQNEKTMDNKMGTKRLCNSPIVISQGIDLKTRSIRTMAVERRFPRFAEYHTFIGYENGMARKTIIPLQFLLKGWGNANTDHQCYIHTITHNVNHIKSLEDLTAHIPSKSDIYHYVGITGRNWLLRLEEHIREMQRGNRRLFYRAWRERYGMDDVHFSSFLADVNLTYEEAMNWEEQNVDRIANDHHVLNMIPGGFKGLRYLHKLRITEQVNISLEERDKAILEYARQNPRKGLPNPFIAELWEDDAFYLKNIGAKQKTLSEDQVRRIRELNSKGWSVPKIKEEVGALNELQVKNVITGRYYKRIQ